MTDKITMQATGRGAKPQDDAPIRKLPRARKRPHPRLFAAPSVAEFYAAIAKAAARMDKA